MPRSNCGARSKPQVPMPPTRAVDERAAQTATKKEARLMLGLSPAHLIIILVIALIVVGPGKLPEVGAAIGKSIKEFQKATGGVTGTLTGVTTPAPVAQAPTAQVQLPAQSYYAAQPVYPAPAYPAPVAPAPAYPAPVAPAPMQYPVMGVVEPAQPAPMGDPQPDAAVQQSPAPSKVD